ncbi:Chromatin assembly factor 1, subunit A [Coemansia aciculifera]|nr:Chromatin assembly factor 1, subunit A [Coemansia aciculifera]
MPMKLFHFHGSRRPDYWGTWSRKLRGVGARRPFGRDTSELDYDVDSDAEWEAEEEGEDLRSEDDDNDDDDEEDDSDDDEDDDDFDEQSGFIVGDCAPRIDVDDDEESGADTDSDTDEQSNFNSEDEVMEDIDPSEEVCNNDGDNGMDIDEPISCRRRHRVAADIASALSAEAGLLSAPLTIGRSKSHTQDQQPSRRAKVQPLTPLVLGLDWCPVRNSSATSALDRLSVRALGLALPLHISVAAQDIQPMRHAASSGLGKSDGPAGALPRKSRDVTDADLLALVDVVHGSSFGIARLVDMLRPLIVGASKAQIERLIHEYAIKEKRPPATRTVWYVRDGLMEQARASRHVSDKIDESALGVAAAAAVSVSDVSETEENSAKRQRITEAMHVS